jgi:hypothetical protein
MRSTTHTKRNTAKRKVMRKARSGVIAVEMVVTEVVEAEAEAAAAAAVEEATTEYQ